MLIIGGLVQAEGALNTLNLQDVVDSAEKKADYTEFDKELYFNKKQKTDADQAKEILPLVKQTLESVTEWNNATLYQALVDLAVAQGIKNGKVLWPARIALTGRASTPGGASEVAEILGKEETLRRLDLAMEMLNK